MATPSAFTPFVFTPSVSAPSAPAERGAERERIACVVLTFNRVELLARCLQAVRAQTHPPDLILVVDNASDADTGEFLAELAWPELRVERLPENIGAAGGFSHGLCLAAQSDANLAWVMDDDCIPEADALAMLLAARARLTARDQHHSFLCSRAVDSAGNTCNTAVPSRKLNASGWPNWADVADDGLVLVDESTFVSILFPIALVTRVGLPLRQMFIWGEDVEFTHRLTDVAPGVFVGRSLVRHERALPGQLSVFNETNAARVGYFRFHYRNRVYLYRKHFPRSRLAAFMIRCGWEFLKLLSAGRLARASIVLRGLLGGLVFRPQIEYPHVRSQPAGAEPPANATTAERALPDQGNAVAR